MVQCINTSRMELNLILLVAICVVTAHCASNPQRKNALSQPGHRVRRSWFDVDKWTSVDSNEDDSDSTTKSTVTLATTTQSTTETSTTKKSKKSKGTKKPKYSDYVINPEETAPAPQELFDAIKTSTDSTTSTTTPSTSTISTSKSTTTWPTTTSASTISTSKSTSSAPTTKSTSSTHRIAPSTPDPYALQKPKAKKTLAAAYIENQFLYMDQFESQLSLSQFQMAYASLVELQRRIGPLLDNLSALLGRECRILWPYLSYDTSTLGYCKTSKKEAEAQLVAFENLLLLSRSYREGAESVKDLTARMHEKYARAMKDSLKDLAHDGRPGDLPYFPSSFPASAPSTNNVFERGQFGFQQPNPLPTHTQVIIALSPTGSGMDGTAPSPADASLPPADISDASLPVPDISDASTASPDISNTYELSKYLDASPLPTTGSPKETLTPPNSTDTTFEPSKPTNQTQESAPTFFFDYDTERYHAPGPTTTLQEAQEEINKTLAEPIGNPRLFLVASLLATVPHIYSQLSYIPPIVNHVISSPSYRLEVTQQNRKYFLYVDSNLTMQATEVSVDKAKIPVGSLWKFVPHKRNEVFLFFNVERRVIMGAQDAWDRQHFKSNSSFIASPMPSAEDSENEEDIRPSFNWTLVLECDDSSNEVDSFGNDTCPPENMYLAIQNSEFHNLKVTMDKEGKPILQNDPISPRIDVITVD